MLNGIIFDLDGTLIDSAPDIIDCIKYAYHQVFPNIKITLDSSWIGPPLSEIIHKITPQLSEAEIQRILSIFRKRYDEGPLPKTKPYPGVLDVLERLKKLQIPLFLVTNKPNFATKKILHNLNLNYFIEIMTPDFVSSEKKDKATLIQILISKYNYRPNKVLMIGDTESDFIAAQKNRIISIIILNGYGDRQKIKNLKPDYIIDSIEYLFELILNKFMNR